MPFPVLLTLVTSATGWLYYAAVNPTVGAAIVAAVASVTQTLLLMRHERHVDERFDERRLVVTHLDDAVLMSDEERRELEHDHKAHRPDRRKEPDHEDTPS